MKLIKALLLCSTLATPLQAAEEGGLSRKQVEELIARYIQEHPAEIMQAVSRYQREAAFQRFTTAAEPYVSYLEKMAPANTLGNPVGTDTIVEFIDYRCGYCRAHYEVMQTLMTEFPSVRWVIKPMWILDNGDDGLSRYAAAVGLAAEEQGKFPAYHHEMFTAGAQISSYDAVLAAAAQAGLDLERLKAAIASPEFQKRLENIKTVTQDAGFWEAGTPGYLVNGKAMIGAEGIDAMRGFVRAAIE